MALWASHCTSRRSTPAYSKCSVSLPLNQTPKQARGNKKKKKGNQLFCSFYFDTLLFHSPSKELAPSSHEPAAITKTWQNVSVPSSAHLFSVPVCLRPSVPDMMWLLYFTVDIVLWMSEHFANEEAWTPDRLCRRRHDTLARTCCAA